MAHIKEGLEYFSLDTNMESDDKIRLIEKHHGITGFAILIKLYLKIYSQGYYCKWSELENMLIADSNNLEEETTTKIINDFLKYDIFSKPVYDSYSVLTSKGIQVRYLEARSRNLDVEIIREYLLLSDNVLSKRKNLIKIIPLSATICDNLLQPATECNDLLPLAQKKIECLQKGKESKEKENKVYSGETENDNKYPLINSLLPFLSFVKRPFTNISVLADSCEDTLQKLKSMTGNNFQMIIEKQINYGTNRQALINSVNPVKDLTVIASKQIDYLVKYPTESKPKYNYNDDAPVPTYQIIGDDDDE